MQEIHLRVEKAIKTIVQACDKQGVHVVVLCTHAATNIALGRALTRNAEVSLWEGGAG
jgi:transcription factor C subunit 7